MKLALRSLSLALAFSSLATVAGCAADTSTEDDAESVVDSEEALTSGAPSNFGYFVVTRHDMRRCISPICGGFFVKRVNQATTRCADGSRQAECYVSSIELGGTGLSEREQADLRAAVDSGKALLHGAQYKTKFNGLTLGKLKANEGWLGATGSVPDGTFYRTANNGIMCVRAPCPTTTAYGLNGGDSHNVLTVHLDSTTTPADEDSIARAQQAIGTKEGILVAGGVALPKCLPTSTTCGPFVTASEFYLRVTPREGKSCGGRGMGTCNANQFCSWTPQNICGAFDAGGQCAYKPEVCTQLFQPVCGCDGKTYSNACFAAAGGTSVSSQGACKP